MSNDPPEGEREASIPVEQTQVSGQSDSAEFARSPQPPAAEPVRFEGHGGTQWAAGQLIEDRFEVRAVAGVGGMGVVYRACDLSEGRDVAVKVLHPGAERERFQREARLLSQLSHENVVRYITQGTLQDRQMYLVMEWLEGHDLASHLQRFRLSIRQSVEVVTQVARGLSVAHGLGVVHRDINPRNIFLVGGEVSRVKVLDFGVARPTSSTQHLTSAGSPIGTPGYMAPEQAQGAVEISAAADVFSLGCVLFECLTGQRAFAGQTLMELFARILVDDVPRVSRLVASTPAVLDELVVRMLAKHAEVRPQNAGEVAEALAGLEYLSDAPLPEIAPVSSSAITDTEQRISSIILVSSISDAELEDAMRAALEHGVHAKRMADGSILAVVANRGSATDQVALAARCALDLAESVSAALITVATGRAVTNGQKPIGEAIERASSALVRAAKRHIKSDASVVQSVVFLDPVTAGLLDERFDVRQTEAGLLLVGMREATEPVRTVLGRRTRCVGRRRELSLLSSTLEECVEESVARAVLISGPSGIGKTRLAHEFLRHARRELPDVLVLSARGEPTSVGSPFAVLGRVLRSLAQVVDRSPATAQQQALLRRLALTVDEPELERVHQFLCELMATPIATHRSPQLHAARLDHVLAGDQMLRAFEDWLSFECRAHPVLLVLDDLHWGDLPSVKFLDSVLRNLAELPLMVVALGQPEVHEMFPGLWARRGLFELRLSGLSRRASEGLVRDVLGGDVAADVVGRIIEKAQGNPFWLEELVRAEAESEQAPEAIVLLAQVRLQRLASEARLVLRAASVLGRRFWEAGVLALLGSKLNAVQLARLLATLEESEVVTGRTLNQPSGQREYEFCSALLRDAAYGTLTEADRERAHYAAATWLEQQGATDAVALAEHFEKGGATQRALDWYRKAAQQALSGNDWQAARERARRARAAGAQGELRISLIVVEAEASKWLGDNAAALASSLEVLKLSRRAEKAWCRACGEAIATAGKLGRDSVYRDLAPELLSVEPEAENLVPLMIALSRGATQLVLCGEPMLAAQLLARVEQLCGLGEPPATAMGFILEARAIHAGATDHASERVTLAEAAADQFELTGDLRNACLQRISVGFACVEVGAYARARAALSEGLEVAKRMALSNSIPIARAQLGRALLYLGKLEPARALLHEASAELDRHGNTRLAGAVRCYLATLLLQQGNLQEAERISREAVSVLEAVPSLRPSALATLAMVLLEQGEAEHALAIARQANAGVGAETRLNFGEALVRLSLVLALQQNGLKDDALAYLRDAHRRLQERAALISDPELKDGFLTAVPENARTIRMAESLQL